MLNIDDMPVVMIGGGDVAFRKVKDLLDRKARVKVIATVICFEIHALKDIYEDQLIIEERPYEKNDLEGAALVFSATNNSDVNKEVYKEAMERNIFINAVDDPPNCTFIVPSYFQRDDLIVSISTSGASPAMSARLRREIEKAVPQNIEEVLRALKNIRIILMNDESFIALDFEKRGKLLKKIVQNDDLLKEMLSHYHKDTLIDFIKSI